MKEVEALSEQRKCCCGHPQLTGTHSDQLCTTFNKTADPTFEAARTWLLAEDYSDPDIIMSGDDRSLAQLLADFADKHSAELQAELTRSRAALLAARALLHECEDAVAGGHPDIGLSGRIWVFLEKS